MATNRQPSRCTGTKDDVMLSKTFMGPPIAYSASNENRGSEPHSAPAIAAPVLPARRCLSWFDEFPESPGAASSPERLLPTSCHLRGTPTD
jgi:hypothetical protein